MKNSYLHLLTLLVTLFTSSIAFAEYTKADVAGTAMENPTINWAAGDDSSIQVNLGFSFPLGNQGSYTQVRINSNGALTLSANSWTAYNNTDFPVATPTSIIAPYWDDLNRSSGGTIKYQTFGAAGNKRFVVSWNAVPHYGNTDSYSFQTIFYENGDIRFRYDNACTSCTGVSATIGVQESNSEFDKHLFNQATLDRTKDIFFARVPTPLLPATSPTCASPSPQLALSTYNKTGYNHPNNHADFNSLVTNYAIPSKIFGSGLISNINTPTSSNNNPYQAGTDENYLSIIKGYIYAPQDGVYKFGVDGDDAIEVIIDGTVVTGWYGGHGRSGSATNIADIGLETGYHTLEFRHEEAGGGDNYYLYWKTPSQGSLSIVPNNSLSHCPYDAYVSLSKTSMTLSDPVNGPTNPKAIPGAIVEYTLTAKNAGSAPSDNSIVRDSLNALITTQQYATWAGGFLTIQTPNLYGGAKTTLTDNPDSDEGQFIDSAGNREIVVDCGTLTTGQNCIVTYRIIIN